MRNTSHLHLRSVITSLVIHYAHLENTLVNEEVPVALTLSPWGCYRIPDLIVAFDCDISDIYDLSGYAIDRQGKPPNFVLKVASKRTGIADYTSKRSDYERYGAPDYWRFDPTECERHAVALATNVLTEHAEYQPIEIEWITERRCRGYSEALGLYVCWEDGLLRFYYPISQSYLRTHDEEAEARQAAEARVEDSKPKFAVCAENRDSMTSSCSNF